MRAALLQRSAFSERCWWVVGHATSLCHSPSCPPFHGSFWQLAVRSTTCPFVRQLAHLFDSSPFCLMLDSVLVECQREFQSKGKGLTMFAGRELHSGEFFYRSTLSYLTGLYANDATSNWLMWYANGQSGHATSTPTSKQWCLWCQDPNEWRQRPFTTTDSKCPPPVPQPMNNNGPWVPTDSDEPWMPTTHRGRPVPTIPITTRTTVDDSYVPWILAHGTTSGWRRCPCCTSSDYPCQQDHHQLFDSWPRHVSAKNNLSVNLSMSALRMTTHMTLGPYDNNPPSPPSTNDDNGPPLPPHPHHLPSMMVTAHTIATTATCPHHPSKVISANTGCWGTLVFPVQRCTQCQMRERSAMWDTTTTTKGDKHPSPASTIKVS